jgi:tRNA(Ile)-lysidine synthase
MITAEDKSERVLEGFLRTLTRFRMLEKGDSILVAVSGGPDSVALFDLLYQIRTDWHLDLHIVHLNHCLRGEASEKDQMFAERFAKDLKVPISIKKMDVEKYARDHRMTLEEAARECRFEFFKEEADRLGIRKVALGHHRDDQAETVLFRILRGTGLKGLAGIKPVGSWQGLVLLRPLIDFEKKDIEDYARSRKLTYCVDVSNREMRFMRNRIRHRLLPELERYYNPRVKQALAALAETLSLDLAFLEDLVAGHYGKVVKKRKEGLILLKKKKFLGEPEALRFRILQRAVKELDPESELDYGHWNEFRKALESGRASYEMHVLNEVSISVERKEIVLKRALLDKTHQYEYRLEVGKTLVVKEANLEFTTEAYDRRIYKVNRRDRTCGIFDLDKIKLPVVVRNRREGDVFQPLGLPFTKKLKDFFIARRVPSYEKNRIPLFLSGGDVFWIYGVEISDRFKVTHETRRFLKISGRSL